MDRGTIMQAYFGMLVLWLTLYRANADIIDGHDPECTYDDEENFEFELCINVTDEYYCPVNDTVQNWFYELYNKAINDTGNPTRIRREIRTLSKHERHVLFRAINDLKQDKSIEPNKYDAIASVHFNKTLCAVHKGSNFLGWHRVYVLLFEQALREKDKSIVLPYWASTIDNSGNTDPKKSVLFTPDFVGNGDGYVKTGPFGGWKDRYGCPIERNTSNVNRTEFISPPLVDIIETDLQIDIIDATDAGTIGVNRSTTIEYQHNLVHNWVGGMMQVLDASPRDPIFFLHHAYVDYIWEKFRMKQEEQNGTDPALYYPALGNDNYTLARFNAADRKMSCFPWMNNKDGYAHGIYGLIYTYADLPSCPSCGSEFLVCDPDRNICIQNHTAKLDSTTSKASPLCTNTINVVVFVYVYVAMLMSTP